MAKQEIEGGVLSRPRILREVALLALPGVAVVALGVGQLKDIFVGALSLSATYHPTHDRVLEYRRETALPLIVAAAATPISVGWLLLVVAVAKDGFKYRESQVHQKKLGLM